MKSLLQFASVCLLGLSTVLNAHAQSGDSERFVLESKEAVLVLPSELIAAPSIKRVFPSPDGYRLLVLREKMKITPENFPDAAGKSPKMPEGEQELIYWNARTRVARSIWKGVLFENNVVEVGWMPQTDTVFLVTQTLPPKALLLNPTPDIAMPPPAWKLLKVTEGQSRPIDIPLPNIGLGGSVSLSASKIQPLIMLHITQDHNAMRPDGSPIRSMTMYLIRKDGRIDVPLAIPDADKAMMILPTWDKAGNPLLYWVGNEKKGVHYAVDPKTLAVTSIEGKFESQEYEEPDRTRAGVLSLKPQKMMASVGETRKPISTLWLESSVESEYPRLVLSSDATEGSLLPKGDGALYQSQGALWYAPFLRLNEAQFLAARRAALKQIAMSNAKQAGLGLMMYAQDFDSTLPDPDGVKEKVSPYVKNGDVLDGLVYTHEGGKLTDIDKPAETIMGYVPGPGGRANIYADGHVKWEDNPKP